MKRNFTFFDEWISSKVFQGHQLLHYILELFPFSFADKSSFCISSKCVEGGRKKAPSPILQYPIWPT